MSVEAIGVEGGAVEVGNDIVEVLPFAIFVVVAVVGCEEDTEELVTLSYVYFKGTSFFNSFSVKKKDIIRVRIEFYSSRKGEKKSL
jgi:hypothetical protein